MRALGLLVGVAGCFSPTYQPGGRCGANGACPSPFVCDPSTDTCLTVAGPTSDAAFDSVTVDTMLDAPDAADRCGPTATYASCLHWRASCPQLGDGLFTIDPGGTRFQAYCDMTTDGGGWTLVAALGNRRAALAAPAPFFTQTLVQTDTAWQVDPDHATPLVPSTRGILDVTGWPAPVAIRYAMIDSTTNTVKNAIVFDDAASIAHLQQYGIERDVRTGSAVGTSLPFAVDRTFYYASDNDDVWDYWGGIMGRHREAGHVGWQFGVSVNQADGVAAYDAIHDDQSRGEYNLGVGANPNYAGDVTGYWAGKCVASCNEDWSTTLGPGVAVVQVWHR